MKKNNISIVVFLFITFIMFMFIVYNTNFESKPVISGFEDKELIIKKPNSIIKYNSKDNDFMLDSDKTIYLSTDILSEDLGVKVHFDPRHNIAVITTLDRVIRFYGNTDKVKVNNKEADYIKSMIMNGEKPLIPINQIKEDLKIENKFFPETNTIVVKSLYDDEIIGKIDRDNVILKKDIKIWSKVIRGINKGEEVQIIGEADDWIKILTHDGKVGFVKKKLITNIEEIVGIKPEKNNPIWKPEKNKIILTWESVYSRNPDTSKIKDMDGLNVISPTWIHLIGADGKLNHNIGKDYINWAKKRGYKIWALFSNSFDPKLTDKFLNNSLARERVINDLLNLIKDNNLDGINIDFENVYLKNKELLVQFIREMTPVFHENNLVVSIDVTVIGGSDTWSRFLDRKALGEVVDYMAVMTYDEHWASSPVSGSVASIGWVEKSIERIIKEVPSEKLLLGVPLYTRIWTETPSRERANKMYVESRAVPMKNAMKILDKENIVKIWDEGAGQYYIAYIENNKLNKIWFENAESIKLKTDLVKKYNLAGVAAWRRGYETEEIWNIIDKNIN
ncbi:glycosyl hydrolase family 18 protein [Maledivibacter halophilus]|uniref:Spore germination protein YaaH n=1 Tax=Maledivibacter halophilus TaxID=36842 RepID=A0A1T5MAM2_9FIRM|nr:glycosyl hydrolase family 18 protein [Maledivibacter halophilus]SKC84898.1 Spore germination protein YaaH [Maledivibacter halophilus]